MNVVKVATKNGSKEYEAVWIGNNFAVAIDPSCNVSQGIIHLKSGCLLRLPKQLDSIVWEDAIDKFNTEVAKLLESTDKLIAILDSCEFGSQSQLSKESAKEAVQLFEIAAWCVVERAISKTYGA